MVSLPKMSSTFTAIFRLPPGTSFAAPPKPENADSPCQRNRHEGVLREAMRHDGQWCDFLVMGLLEDEWRALRRDTPAAGPR